MNYEFKKKWWWSQEDEVYFNVDTNETITREEYIERFIRL